MHKDPNAPPSPYTAMLNALATRYGPEVAAFAADEWRHAANVRYRYEETKKNAAISAQRTAHAASKGRT